MPIDAGHVAADSLAFSEFTFKKFERDKDGNWIDGIPDGSGHSIDATRYAMMEDVLRG